MTKRDLRGWIIVAVCILTLIAIWGGTSGTTGEFIPALSKAFGWSRARVSSLATFGALGLALGCPVAGWMLDRELARPPIVIGAILAGIAWIGASRAHSFDPMAVAYFVAGIGCGMSTTVPASVLVPNWFKRNRGVAMGLTMVGASAGGMIMVEVAAQVTRVANWRTAYMAIGIPMLVLIIPLVILVVRLRPAEDEPPSETAAQTTAVAAIIGLTLRESFRTRSFWYLLVLGVLWYFFINGVLTQLVIYLIGIGYSRGAGALALSIAFGATAIGKFVFGYIADWIGARASLFLAFVMMAVGCVLLIFSRHEVFLVLFLGIYGLAWGSPLALMPLVTIDSLGLKYFGSIGGVLSAINIAGSGAGPIAIGFLYDLTKSYTLGFLLCFAFAVICGVLTLGCKSEIEGIEEGRTVAASA